MPWAPFCAMVLPMWTMLSAWSKQSHGCSCPGCKATNHTGTLRNLLNPLPTLAGTLRNPPELSEPCLWNLHQHAPELSGTLQNLPRPSGTNLSEPTPAYAGTVRNLPEPGSGTYTSTRRNSPEPSGTFRNLPPEPAPATLTGTHRCLSGLKTPLAYAVGEKKIKGPDNPTCEVLCRSS